MAMDGLRGYLQLASGLAEMSRARATEAASALLSLSGGLAGARSTSTVQVQVQDLAEELLAAASANRRSLIALVRSEVERALARSPIPPDELDRARTAIAKLSADVEELRTQVLGNPAVGEVASRLGLVGSTPSRPVSSDIAPTGPDRSDDGVVVDAVFTDRVDETVVAPPRRRPPRRQISERGAAHSVPEVAGATAVTTPSPRRAAATKSTAAKATTNKATPSGSTAKKATAKRATANVTTAKKSTAKKSTATPDTAKKSTTKRSAAKKSTAGKSTAKKSAATPRTGGGS